MRKGMKLASLTLRLKHDSAASPQTLETTVIPSAGFKGNTTIRALDYKETEQKDYLFGDLTIKMGVFKASEVDDEFLSEGWVDETIFREVVEKRAQGIKTDGVRISCYCWSKCG